MSEEGSERQRRRLTVPLAVAVAVLVGVFGLLWFVNDPGRSARNDRSRILDGLPEPSELADTDPAPDRDCPAFGNNCSPDYERVQRDGFYGAYYDGNLFDLGEIENLAGQRLTELGYSYACTFEDTDFFETESNADPVVGLEVSDDTLSVFVLTTVQGPREIGSRDYAQFWGSILEACAPDRG